MFDAVKGRRSVRRFRSDKLPKEKLDRILEAASWAPSAGNLQARDFILVENQETRRQLSEAAFGQDFIEQAPAVIVVCANLQKSARHYGRRGETLYALQDATAAVQNILLGVYSLGLGSCWVGAFDDEEVKKILGVPEGVIPVAILPIGVPDENPKTLSRKTEVHKEKW